MAEIKPFNALRYDLSKIDISKVVCPPYDVISDAQRDELYKKDSNNAVRIEHPKPEREDLSGEEKYGRAKNSLQEMINRGVLVQDEKPSFYLYEQVFRHPEARKKYSRLGLFCLVKVEEFEEGNIIPHEKTHKAAKDDRFKLLKETQTNTSPIYGLYEDPESLVSEIYDNDEAELLTEFSDDNGDRHRLFRISDEKRVEQIQAMVAKSNITIADGHHRYTTAINYKNHVERLGQKKDEDDYTLFCLTEWDEPGLLVLPIHRILRSYGKMSRVEFLVRLKRDFILKEISLQQVPQVVRELERDFVIYLGGNYAYHAMLKDPEILKAELPEGKPEVWYDLTVTWFDQLICKRILGLEDERDFSKTVAYNSSYKAAMTEVTAGTARAAFLFSATEKSEMQDIVGAGDIMPQKSTFFYPKLLTGLVVYPHFEPAAFSQVRRDKGRDTRRGGRKIQVVSTVAAQIKAESERKEAKAAEKAKEEAEAEVKKAEEAAAQAESPEVKEEEVPKTEEKVVAEETKTEEKFEEPKTEVSAESKSEIKEDSEAEVEEKKEEKPSSQN